MSSPQVDGEDRNDFGAVSLSSLLVQWMQSFRRITHKLEDHGDGDPF